MSADARKEGSICICTGGVCRGGADKAPVEDREGCFKNRGKETLGRRRHGDHDRRV